MDTRTLQQLTDWFHGTDLVELAYRRSGVGFELRADGAAPPAAPAFPGCSLVPVLASEVGIFRWSNPGTPRRAEKGAEVGKGEVLGLLEVGARRTEIKAPCAGRLMETSIEEGQAVQYGQALFFLQPIG